MRLIFASQFVEIDQSRYRIGRRGGLVEPNVSSSTDTQNLYVYSSIRFDLFLIVGTKLGDVLSFYFSIWNIDICRGNVDVFEQILVHVVMIRVGVAWFYGIVFVQVERHHILKTQLSVLVKSDKFSIDSQGTASRGKP